MPSILMYILTTLAIIVPIYILRLFYSPIGWMKIFMSIIISGFIGLIINGLILFTKEDRNVLKNTILKKVGKK